MSRKKDKNKVGPTISSDEPLTADGFNSCFIGYFQRVGGLHLAVYDYGLCIDLLMKDGISWEDATEHMEFNVVGAWVGEGTPVFMHRTSIEDFQSLAGEYYG